MVFGKYSTYYDDLYQDKDYKKEVGFLLKTFKKYSERDVKNILSLGCGTCSYEVMLANKGYGITGVDISKDMLDIAREKLTEKNLLDKVVLKKADVREFSVPHKHDLAMAMFNVVGYQIENSAFERMLINVRNSLKKNSLFVFDCWHAPAVYKDPPAKRIKRVVVNKNTIIRETNSKVYPTKDLIEISFELKVLNKAKVIDRVREIHNMRYWSIPELEYFLAKNGFDFVDAVNFMNFSSKVSDNYWNIFIVAKKK